MKRLEALFAEVIVTAQAPHMSQADFALHTARTSHVVCECRARVKLVRAHHTEDFPTVIADECGQFLFAKLTSLASIAFEDDPFRSAFDR